jgi:two-component system phosphate regulon response regulator PhoB
MSEDEPRIQVHGIVIGPTSGEVSIHGVPVVLSRAEFLLLRFLASHAGVAFTRQQIIEGIQGPNYPATDRSVDVQVTGLRKKLGDLGQLIETVRGVGYRFQQ